MNANTLQAPAIMGAPASSTDTESNDIEQAPTSPIDQLKDESPISNNESSTSSSKESSSNSQSPLDQIKSQ